MFFGRMVTQRDSRIEIIKGFTPVLPRFVRFNHYSCAKQLFDSMQSPNDSARQGGSPISTPQRSLAENILLNAQIIT